MKYKPGHTLIFLNLLFCFVAQSILICFRLDTTIDSNYYISLLPMLFMLCHTLAYISYIAMNETDFRDFQIEGNEPLL